MRSAGSVVRALTAAVCAAAAAAAATARADEPAVDFGAIGARVDLAIADAGTGPVLRPRYVAVARRLAKPDRPGLSDDWLKLERVAIECRRTLVQDTVLLAALDGALDDGEAELAGIAVSAVRASLLVDEGAARRRIDRLLVKARRAQDAVERNRIFGRDDRACRSGAASAAAYAHAEELAEKLVRKQDARPATWKTSLEGLSGALLSVWVAPAPSGGPGDVYTVGASAGGGPLFLRGSPEGFVRIPVAASGDLWWVDGVPGAGVWACGTEGRVVRYDPADGDVTDLSTGALATHYGLWGSSPFDVWVVGADPDGTGPESAVRRFEGAAWTQAVLPEEVAGKTLFKVWGTAFNDVWVCGQGGVLLHFDGETWSAVASGTPSTLLTVHGASPTTAVGGPGVAAVIVERGAGGAFAPAALPAGTESLNGVFVPPTGDAWAVGYFGTVLRRTKGVWRTAPGVPKTLGRHHHAVHVDAAGGVWVAGGDLFTMTSGSLLYYGPRSVATDVLPRARLSDIFQPVLYASCAFTACHVDPFLSEELDLETEDDAFAGLVEVPSRQSPLLRVAPGRPSQSYLWHKMQGTHLAVGGSGDRMPQGEDPLNADKMAQLRAWILEGALDD